MVLRRKSAVRAGRPSLYSEQLAAEICRRVAGGGNLLQISRDGAMPGHATLHRWLNEIADFRDNYLQAREARADARSDRMDVLVDAMLAGDLDPRVASVALTHERWMAGREAPKRYGDRMALDADVNMPPVRFIIVRTSRSGERGDAEAEG